MSGNLRLVDQRRIEPAERAILGTALINQDAARVVAREMLPSDFLSLETLHAFEAICDLIGRGIVADFVTVAEELRRRGRLDQPMLTALGDFTVEATGVEALPFKSSLGQTTGTHAGHFARLIGERRAVRAAREAAARIVAEAEAGVRQTDDFVDRARAAVANALRSYVVLDRDRTKFDQDIERYVHALIDNRPSDLPPILTDLAPLDAVIGGIDREKLTVVAGRPGMGKSSFLAHLALVASARGERVVWFALEETRDTVLRRLVSIVSGIPSDAIHRRAWRGDDDIRALAAAHDALHGRPVHIICRRPISGARVADEVARVREAEGDVSLVLLDHTVLMREPGRWDGKKHAEVTQSIESLCAVAKNERAAVVAAHQLNRDVEHRRDRRPTLADLRESGSVEESARLVMFLYRPVRYAPDTADPQELQVLVAKNSDGRTGTVRLRFEEECVRIEA